MCDICGKIPCWNGCPNAEEKPVHICKKCRNGIYENEEYYDSPEGIICMECMEEMPVSEILSLLGDKLSIA